MTADDLWLIRHGESVANVAATRAEREALDVIPLDIRDADVALSPTGEDQARALGTWIARRGERIGAVWSSPYLRARQTLALALDEAGATATVAVAVDERLRDRELGVLDLLTRQGVARLQPAEAERRRHLGKYYHRPPGGESWADVALRLRSFLRDLPVDGRTPGDGGETVIVSHDAVTMLIVALLVGWDEQTLLEFAAAHTVLNASVTRLRRTGEGWGLVDFADVAHLHREGAPVTVHPGSPDVEPR